MLRDRECVMFRTQRVHYVSNTESALCMKDRVHYIFISRCFYVVHCPETLYNGFCISSALRFLSNYNKHYVIMCSIVITAEEQEELQELQEVLEEQRAQISQLSNALKQLNGGAGNYCSCFW
jgi:hypothetical protein